MEAVASRESRVGGQREAVRRVPKTVAGRESGVGCSALDRTEVQANNLANWTESDSTATLTVVEMRKGNLRWQAAQRTES